MLALLLLAWDEAAGGAPAPAPLQPSPFSNPIFIIMGLVLLFFLLVIRPMNRRQEEERKSLVSTLDKNDEILTIGGIYGTVVSFSEKEDEMIVRLEDNARMKMTRSSIARNLTKEQKAKDAKQESAAAKEPSK